MRAAETLRENAPQASITLISGEPGEPYARMAIPYILTGAIDESTTFDKSDFRNIVPRFSTDARKANNGLVEVLGDLAAQKNITLATPVIASSRRSRSRPPSSTTPRPSSTAIPRCSSWPRSWR